MFTWAWEVAKTGTFSDETLITVSLRPVGDATELTLVHERLPSKEEVDKHTQGWIGCLEKLPQALAA